MKRLVAWVVVGWLLFSPSVWAEGQVGFIAQSQVSAQSQRLFGQMELTLQGEEIGQAQVFLYGPTGPQSVLTVPNWQPEQKQTFKFDFPNAHPWPGFYHLLVEIRFQDQAGAWLSSAMGVAYRLGNAVQSQAKPVMTLRGEALEWPSPPLKEPSLTVTTGPHWRVEQTPFTPADSRFKLLLQTPDASPLFGWQYAQLARLDWVEEGVHQSQLFPWLLRTDATGKQWQAENQTAANKPNAMAQLGFGGWLTPFNLLLMAFGLLVLFINRAALLNVVRRMRPR